MYGPIYYIAPDLVIQDNTWVVELWIAALNTTQLYLS